MASDVFIGVFCNKIPKNSPTQRAQKTYRMKYEVQQVKMDRLGQLQVVFRGGFCSQFLFVITTWFDWIAEFGLKQVGLRA